MTLVDFALGLKLFIAGDVSQTFSTPKQDVWGGGLWRDRE